jgi:hypothetical protein
MADVERIAPLVPTVPTPIGRNVGSRRKPAPEREHQPTRSTPDDVPESLPPKPESEHIDEYV